jgi:hypothetical protein
VYLDTLGPRESATMPDTPAPSSRTVDERERRSDVKRKFVGEEIHDAKRGVTFHTTARRLVFLKGWRSSVFSDLRVMTWEVRLGQPHVR